FGNLGGIKHASRADLYDLSSNDFAEWIVAIHEGQRSQGERKSPVESFDLFRLDLAVPQQPIDRHRPCVQPHAFRAESCGQTISNWDTRLSDRRLKIK